MFINFLMFKLRLLILKKLNRKKLKLIDEYVNEKELFEKSNKNSKIKFNSYYAIHFAVRNIVCINLRGKFIIKLKENINLPGFNTPILEICKFIDYGNYEFEGYPIFTNAFMNIRNNIVDYYKIYNGRVK